MLRPACGSVGPCSIRTCLSWQTPVAGLLRSCPLEWPLARHGASDGCGPPGGGPGRTPLTPGGPCGAPVHPSWSLGEGGCRCRVPRINVVLPPCAAQVTLCREVLVPVSLGRAQRVGHVRGPSVSHSPQWTGRPREARAAQHSGVPPPPVPSEIQDLNPVPNWFRSHENTVRTEMFVGQGIG